MRNQREAQVGTDYVHLIESKFRKFMRYGSELFRLMSNLFLSLK